VVECRSRLDGEVEYLVGQLWMAAAMRGRAAGSVVACPAIPVELSVAPLALAVVGWNGTAGQVPEGIQCLNLRKQRLEILARWTIAGYSSTTDFPVVLCTVVTVVVLCMAVQCSVGCALGVCLVEVSAQLSDVGLVVVVPWRKMLQLVLRAKHVVLVVVMALALLVVFVAVSVVVLWLMVGLLYLRLLVAIPAVDST